MYTMQDVRRAIEDSAYVARGQSYVREGRVGTVTCTGAWVKCYEAIVRGHGEAYRTMFGYDMRRESFTECHCTCPAFERTQFGCKHVAALMIAVLEGADGAQEERRRAMEQHWEERRRAEEQRRQWEEQRREQLRAQEVFRQQQLRAQEAQRTEFLAELLQSPARQAQEAPVRLFPTLQPVGAEGMLLTLRVGRQRAYVVRNIVEFAQRVERFQWASYGKGLSFCHAPGSFAAEDRPLLMQLVSMTREAVTTGRDAVYMRGAGLDRVMELLLGHEVTLRTQEGDASVRVEAGDGSFPVELKKDRQGAVLRVAAGDAVLGVTGAYFAEPEQKRLLCMTGEAFERVRRVLAVREAYPGGLPVRGEAEMDAVCSRLLRPAMANLEVRSGAQLIAEHTPAPMRPRFCVDMDENGRLTCLTEFDYGERMVRMGEETPGLRRDTFGEREALEAAHLLFPEELAPGEYAFDGSDDDAFALLTERLPGLSAAGEVMVSDRLARMNVTRPRAMHFGLSVQGEGLIMRADLGGFTQQELEEAASAYRQKRKFVRLKDGAFLSGEALEQAAQTRRLLEELDTTAERAEQGETLPEGRALYLEAALADRPQIRLDAPGELRDWMDRLRAAQSATAEPPVGLRCTLRGYQRAGLSWLCALADAGFGGILADDMGLGKTVQALAMLLRAKERGEEVRALVVCPASLQLNWLSEAERFTPGLRAQALMGGAAERRRVLAEDRPELLITSYDQLRRDAPLYKELELSHVLLDEAQCIKNAAAQTARAVKTLHARHRFAMTGTPVENRLSELWSIFDFLMPGYLYTYKRFRERFETPIVREQDEDARRSLRLLAAPFILRRMKKDVLDDLPEKVETVMTSELTAEQRRLYAAQSAKLLREAEGGLADAQDRMRILAGLTRLRQLCCDPRLCLEGYAGGSGKLEQCAELVRDSLEGGHRILLFSQFTSMLELIEAELTRQGVRCLCLTGETPKAERLRLADAFNAGEGDVFLISLKAGGTGLNLVGADVVIHYDPWWNVAAQNQATDRAYRIGQTRGVQVFSLIAAGTVEERILRLQQAKLALGEGVLEGGESLFTIDAELLHTLLKG